MLRVSLLLIFLTHSIRTAHVTDTPFSNRFDKLYQKLEKLTVAPDRQPVQTPQEKLYEKLDRLNSLTPGNLELTDEDEELLSAMKVWGGLSAEQLDGVVKDLQRMKERRDEVADQEYGEPAWEDEEFVEEDYPMDGNDDWDSEDPVDTSSTSKPPGILGVTPSAIIRTAPAKTIVVSAAESIAATNARPRILEDPKTTVERLALRRAAMAGMNDLLRNGKCSSPQPRWLIVRQLAPAADTRYLPPCVQLHRCAHDSGCCVNESEVCAPIEGKAVILPFYLLKAVGSTVVVRMQFFNHTRCACVSRDTLQMTITTTAGKPNFSQEELERPSRRALVENQNDWRAPTEEPILERDEEPTAISQLRRCTCPGLFLASMTENEPCSCVCDWPDASRRRDCQYLAKGREHFGLRDRVCVENRDCTPPSCEYGAYDKSIGRCPPRRYRRIRYHSRGRYQEKTIVV